MKGMQKLIDLLTVTRETKDDFGHLATGAIWKEGATDGTAP